MPPNSPLSRRTLLKTGAALPATAALTSLSAAAQAGSSPYGLPIASEFPFTKKTMSVNGSTMAYVDEGSGAPVVFLHGNPTSSYLWRNIIPYVTSGYRAIAPDLIGMGDSGKPDIAYTFADHAAYLDAFLDTLDLQDATLVIHDWGSALGMRYARRNPDRIRAIAFMEAIVPPAMPVPSFEAMPPNLAELFSTLRSEAGEALVLDQNFFVEKILPDMGVARDMTPAEMDAYRAPFPTRDSRKPTLQWPREVPIGGEPANVVVEVQANGEWLYASDIPKLLFYAEPGAITPREAVDYMTANLANLETRFLGAGLHFVQEDHPHLIGQGLSDWLRRL